MLCLVEDKQQHSVRGSVYRVRERRPHHRPHALFSLEKVKLLIILILSSKPPAVKSLVIIKNMNHGSESNMLISSNILFFSITVSLSFITVSLSFITVSRSFITVSLLQSVLGEGRRVGPDQPLSLSPPRSLKHLTCLKHDFLYAPTSCCCCFLLWSPVGVGSPEQPRSRGLLLSLRRRRGCLASGSLPLQMNPVGPVPARGSGFEPVYL